MTLGPTHTSLTAPAGPGREPDPATRPGRLGSDAVPDGPADHVRMGVGARFSLHPAADDVVPVVLGALDAGRTAVPEVAVHTDDVSTLVRGAEADIVRYLTAVMTHAVRATPSGHVVTTLALSRGCPGEIRCVLPAGGLPRVAPVRVAPVGLRAAAHWALYPLGTPSAMPHIERAIGLARDAGTWAAAETFATRLDGDLAEVLTTLADTWTAVGHEVAHVVTHATVSVGSPTAGGAR